MSLATTFDGVAKSLTKALGTTAVLKEKTVGVWNASTFQFEEGITDIPMQIAPWTNTKLLDPTIIKIGDVLAIGYIDSKIYSDVVIDKNEKIVMAGKTYEVIEIAEYVPEAVKVAYYLVLRLSAS